eukprot:CAMPEP_0179272026 /NCGR_PEP_ID=MMETSP0797-20121207/32281_1 /TAXON_ID=47934 /ORGANISM="Dinophysis acuminata, Strain DAEP01" /LENGTH=255 /DNA_ID=CAMNT_0020980401 /DNA_START=555 /DNA_END=1320 /DNA_ORIENTATION=+
MRLAALSTRIVNWDPDTHSFTAAAFSAPAAPGPVGASLAAAGALEAWAGAATALAGCCAAGGAAWAAGIVGVPLGAGAAGTVTTFPAPSAVAAAAPPCGGDGPGALPPPVGGDVGAADAGGGAAFAGIFAEAGAALRVAPAAAPPLPCGALPPAFAAAIAAHDMGPLLLGTDGIGTAGALAGGGQGHAPSTGAGAGADDGADAGAAADGAADAGAVAGGAIGWSPVVGSAAGGAPPVSSTGPAGFAGAAASAGPA